MQNLDCLDLSIFMVSEKVSHLGKTQGFLPFYSVSYPRRRINMKKGQYWIIHKDIKPSM